MVDEKKVWIHPETEEGELFVCNVDKSRFEVVTWKTKRMGNVAYNANGYEIPYLYPVFVLEAEVNRSRVTGNRFSDTMVLKPPYIPSFA